MADNPEGAARLLCAHDTLSPEGLAEELGKRGIHVSAELLRQKAIQLGACHMLGDTMLLMPEDVDMILREGKQRPPSSATSVVKSRDAPMKHNRANQDVTPVAVYSPATLAKYWACSERHIRNMLATGDFPSFRAGGKLLRIRAEDVRDAELAEGLRHVPVRCLQPQSLHASEALVRKREKPARRLDVPGHLQSS